MKYQRQLWLAVWHLCYWEISVSASALSVSHLKWIWPFFSLGSHLELMCQILWCKLKENILTKFRQKKIFGKFSSLAALLSPACNGVACDVLEGILTLSTVHCPVSHQGTLLRIHFCQDCPSLVLSLLLSSPPSLSVVVAPAGVRAGCNQCRVQSLCWSPGRPG